MNRVNRVKLSGVAAAIVMLQLLVSPLVLADDKPATQKAVLITGASSGIGRNITEHLAAEGYFVYAGARKEEDLIALNKIPNVQSIHLDVTVQEDIDNAVKTVTQGGRGLYAVINNAGVGNVGPLVEIEEKDIAFVMNVNMYGPYRITRAFSPLIIESKGRVIMIGSLFGIVAGPMLGAYTMSKHAVEAYTDTLAGEMAPHGVKVSVIEPGTYKTRIYQTGYSRAVEEAHKSPEAELAEWQKKFFAKGPGAHDNYPPPDKVAEAASDALSSKKPKRRYLVVPDQKQATDTVKTALRKAVELNEDHEFSLDRATLIKMLDEEFRKHEKVRGKKPSPAKK